jgi:oxygen-independent coproporphyrinogen-3 oxidase
MSVERPRSVIALASALPARPTFRALPPLSLYVHIPWCVRKCPYCDFNSHEARGDPPEDAYVAALTQDLEHALPAIWGRRIATVFIGGGTPSLFSPAAIDALLSAIRARVPLMPDAEITLEANPGTFESARFAGYCAAGVNRLSLGIQSFDPRHLRALSRIHDDVEARRAVEAALTIFDNVNLDLMYALPGQTPDEARADLVVALSSGAPHLSLYQLTLEPNTLFHRHPPPLPDEDFVAEFEEHAHALLERAGYFHYETSAYAKPAYEGRHNLNYWRFGDYLGIGAGAHSKLSFADGILRQLRWKHPQRYLERADAGAPIQEEVEVARDDVGFEFMLNVLRLAEGVPSSLFAERTGFPLALVSREIELATRRGLLEPEPTMLKPTALGRRFLNDLQLIFLRDGPGDEPRTAPLMRVEATGVER